MINIKRIWTNLKINLCLYHLFVLILQELKIYLVLLAVYFFFFLDKECFATTICFGCSYEQNHNAGFAVAAICTNSCSYGTEHSLNHKHHCHLACRCCQLDPASFSHFDRWNSWYTCFSCFKYELFIMAMQNYENVQTFYKNQPFYIFAAINDYFF